MGAYATKTGSMEKESLNHGVEPSEACEKEKRDQRCMLEAYSPDVAVPYYLQQGTRNDYSCSTSEIVYGRHRHRRPCMHVADPVNNIDGMSPTSTHRNEPSSMPTNEPVIICHQELIDALDKALAT